MKLEQFDISIRYQHFRAYEFFRGEKQSTPIFDRLALTEDRLIDPAYFISSMMYNIQTPSIYLDGGQKEWVAIDGNKRLNAIKDFHNNVFPLTEDVHGEKCNGFYYRDLSKTYLRSRFSDFTLTVYVFNPGIPKETKLELIKRIQSK